MMVKFIIIAGFAVLLTATASAQEAPKTSKDTTRPTLMQVPLKTKTGQVKTTVNTPPPAPTAPNSWDYYLTSAKATIYTGNDNKEKPSQVQMQMSFGDQAVCNYLVPTWEYRELAVNSVNDLQFKVLYDPTWGSQYEKVKLGHAENGGVKFWIHYTPNFPLDAWKIEKVVFTLEFKDARGNPHPTLGTKTITFTDVRAVLNANQTSLKCEADQFLMPRTFSVGKY